MAAERVIMKNITRIADNEMNKELLSSVSELRNLIEAVKDVGKPVAALERDEDGSIRSKLGNLVALLYQADDLLDEILTRYRGTKLVRVAEDQGANLGLGRTLQRVVNASNRITQQVGLFFSSSSQTVFPSPLARQVKILGQDIDKLRRQLDNEFCNVELLEEPFNPPQSYTLIKNKVIGRDDDKNKIIKILLRPQVENENKSGVSVTSIFGSAGLGKTALAKSVYDDEKVKRHFDLRMWIRVSQISDETDIIREIVESCTNRRSKYKQNLKPVNFLHSRVHQNEGAFCDLLGCQSSDATGTITSYSTTDKEIEAYVRRLRKEIEGKLYLLVLDDACIIQGQRLKDLLAAGARGSQVLVTTRVEGAVLAQTETVTYHRLEGLSDDYSWSLFETSALGQEDHLRNPELEEIGRSIARNCEGVPLNIKVAASFLHGKSKETWLSLKEQLMPNGTHEANKMTHILKVSYSDLPTHLKACFSYCSLFPDEFIFNKHDLISLWIAQGFISPQPYQSSEEIAEKSFLELARRCFFEDVITDDLRNNVTCKMHQIMRKLACKYSAGIISSNMTDSGFNLDSTCKHVSVTSDRDYSLKTISKTMLQAQNLRTLVSVKEPCSNTKIGTLVFNKLISSFKYLRVLAFHDLGIDELSISIGNLIHLRYLDLSKNDGLVTLPKSITGLCNLQTLKLNLCTKLRRLSGNYGELVNLKSLEVDECDSLTCMPLGLEKLNQLETLSRFVVGRDISEDMAYNGLKALQNLNNLKGRLAIEFTGDFPTTIPEDAQAELSNKSDLVELKINWAKPDLNSKKTSNIPSEEEKLSYKQLLEKLKPHSNLKILCIEGYRGGDFPNWAGVNKLATSLPNIVVISIEGCDKCEHLPPFGKLPKLKELTLRHMANVKYVQRERFHRSSADNSQEVFFPHLEKLTLHNFYKLEGWWNEETVVTKDNEFPSFPRLLELNIWNCPKLRSMPLFTQVSKLDLRHVNQELLKESAKKMSSDNKVRQGLGNLRSLRNLPSTFFTEVLKLFQRNANQVNPNDIKIRCLQIKGCSNLKSFKTVRQGLGNLSSLQKLVIEKCHALKSLASELSYLKSLERLEISYCKELNLSDDGRDNSSVSSPWTSLKNLRYLTLREIQNMEYLPEGLKHVQTLRSLCISACASLTVLPQWIGNLTALQHLRIESCKAITRLPDGLKNVKSLMKVEITECPELMKNCKEHTGEDWHKIKHARVLLHKSWRHGLMPEIGASENRSNVHALTDVKYIIIPVIGAAEARI